MIPKENEIQRSLFVTIVLQPARFTHTTAALRDFLTAHQKPQGEEDIPKDQPGTALLQIPQIPKTRSWISPC